MKEGLSWKRIDSVIYKMSLRVPSYFRYHATVIEENIMDKIMRPPQGAGIWVNYGYCADKWNHCLEKVRNLSVQEPRMITLSQAQA